MVDITRTVKTGGGGDYTSLSAFVAGEQSTGGSGDRLFAYCSGGADTTSVNLSGFNSGVQVIIAGDPAEADGLNLGDTFDETKYHLKHTGSGIFLQIISQDVILQGMQFLMAATGNASTMVRADQVTGGAAYLVDRCRFKHDSTANNHRAYHHNANTQDSTVLASTFQWGSTGGASITVLHNRNTDVIVWNCVFSDGNNGISATSNGDIIVRNSCFLNNTVTDINRGGAGGQTVQFNVAEQDFDTDFTETTNEQYGVSGFTSIANTFTDEANGDYTLKSGSSAIGAGTTGGPTTDLNGKSFANPPSMGAFEFAVAPTGGNPWYLYRQQGFN